MSQLVTLNNFNILINLSQRYKSIMNTIYVPKTKLFMLLFSNYDKTRYDRSNSRITELDVKICMKNLTES